MKFFESLRQAIVKSGHGRAVAGFLGKAIKERVSCDRMKCFRLEFEHVPHARCPNCSFIAETTL